LTLQDEQATNRALLNSGAPISAMNAVRKHVSTIKGGRLALAAHPARVVSLIVSDVPGDDPAQVASGPTVPDRTALRAALEHVDVHRIKLPDRVRDYLEAAPAAPAPDDERFARNTVSIVASATLSLEAAAVRAERHGIRAFILSDAVEGEARDVGLVHAAVAREVRLRGRPFAAPAVILSGGETTVTVEGDVGRGGRNSEFLLAFAGGAEGLDVAALAADTDGIDGTEGNAGAFADGRTWARMRKAGLNPGALLARHDSWTGFNVLEDLFTPGPTGTNVNDFRAILVR